MNGADDCKDAFRPTCDISVSHGVVRPKLVALFKLPNLITVKQPTQNKLARETWNAQNLTDWTEPEFLQLCPALTEVVIELDTNGVRNELYSMDVPQA